MTAPARHIAFLRNLASPRASFHVLCAVNAISENPNGEDHERHFLAAFGARNSDDRMSCRSKEKSASASPPSFVTSRDAYARRSVQEDQGGLRFWTLPNDGRKLGIIDGRTGEGSLNNANRGALSGDTAHLTGMALSGEELYGVAYGDVLYKVSQKSGTTSAQKLQCENCGGSFKLFSMAAAADDTIFASGKRARDGAAGLFRINPEAGQVEWIGRHRHTGVLLDLAMNGTQLVGLSFDNRLYDIATGSSWSGEATRLGKIDCVNSWTSGITFVDGLLFATDYSEPSIIYTVSYLHPRDGCCRATEINPGTDTGLDLAHVLTSPQEKL